MDSLLFFLFSLFFILYSLLFEVAFVHGGSKISPYEFYQCWYGT